MANKNQNNFSFYFSIECLQPNISIVNNIVWQNPLLKFTHVNFNFNYSSRPITVLFQIPTKRSTTMSGSSTHSLTSLTDGRKAPFTESTCNEVFEEIDTRSSIGITSELRRARLEVSLKRSPKRTVNLMKLFIKD